MSRRTTKDERDLFHAVLSGQALARKVPPATKSKPATKAVQPAKPTGGVDGHTGEKLRRGELRVDAKLDLHGLTEAVAHRTLQSFMLSAQRRGDKLLLVVTGKGAPAADSDAPFDLELAGRRRGVLKAMVPRWLGEPPLARLIADTRQAHRRHGGDGALYVYLRKKT